MCPYAGNQARAWFAGGEMLVAVWSLLSAPLQWAGPWAHVTPQQRLQGHYLASSYHSSYYWLCKVSSWLSLLLLASSSLAVVPVSFRLHPSTWTVFFRRCWRWWPRMSLFLPGLFWPSSLPWPSMMRTFLRWNMFSHQSPSWECVSQSAGRD